jgi:3-phenylpropionate/trans-cinnamate dioxygenase ferredoxin subunit
MSTWLDVIDETALANDEHILVELDGTAVAVFKVNDSFYALEDVCSHDGTEIASGTIEGEELVCPRHGARFCLKTGAVKCAPAYEDIASFPVRIAQGKVQIKDNRWD